MFYIGALTAIKVRHHHPKLHPCRFNPYGKLPLPAPLEMAIAMAKARAIEIARAKAMGLCSHDCLCFLATISSTRALIKKHKAALEKNSASFPKYVQDTIALKNHIPKASPCCSCAF